MQICRSVAIVMFVAALACAGGCKTPAYLVWSPDGTRAVYFNDSLARLIDENGNVIKPLGMATGGFAWSADSTTLYAALLADAETGQPVPGEHPRDGEGSPPIVMGLFAVRDKRVTPLCQLGELGLTYLALSPDGNWLAINGFAEEEHRRELYAYSLRDGRLHPIASDAGFGACFVAPDRLAFFSFSGDEESDEATLVEVELSADGEHKVDRRPFRIDTSGWIASSGIDLLFTGMPTGSGRERGRGRGRGNLYSVAPGAAKPKVVVEDVGPEFLPSPDGEKVLVNCAGRLRVLDRGSGRRGRVHVLRKLSEEAYPVMYPSWRGNDQITFTSPKFKRVGARGSPEEARVYEVVLYELTDRWRLRPLRTLSRSWPDEMKPTWRRDPVLVPSAR